MIGLEKHLGGGDQVLGGLDGQHSPLLAGLHFAMKIKNTDIFLNIFLAVGWSYFPILLLFLFDVASKSSAVLRNFNLIP